MKKLINEISARSLNLLFLQWGAGQCVVDHNPDISWSWCHYCRFLC